MEKPWKVILAFIGVFVAGATFGGLLALRLARQLASQPARWAGPGMTPPPAGAPGLRSPGGPPNPPMPQAVQSAQLMRRVTSQIGLTKPQRERVMPIIERAVQDFWRQHQGYNRENGFLLQRLKQDIGRELTPEQQVKLDELWGRHLEIFRKRQSEAREQTRGVRSPGPASDSAPDVKPAPAETAAGKS
jgi:hypothetical protein